MDKSTAGSISTATFCAAHPNILLLLLLVVVVVVELYILLVTFNYNEYDEDDDDKVSLMTDQAGPNLYQV